MTRRAPTHTAATRRAVTINDSTSLATKAAVASSGALAAARRRTSRGSPSKSGQLTCIAVMDADGTNEIGAEVAVKAEMGDPFAHDFAASLARAMAFGPAWKFHLRQANRRRR